MSGEKRLTDNGSEDNNHHNMDYLDATKFSEKQVILVDKTSSKVNNTNYFFTFICDDWWEGWIPIMLKEEL